MSIRVFALADNPFKDNVTVNRIRAFGSQAFIITKAVDVDKYVSAASIVALVSKLVLTMLGLITPTFVVIIGDKTRVFVSIKQ